MMLVLTLMVVGCTTTQGRFNPNAKIKAKRTVCTHSCSQESCCKKQAPNHGDKLGKQLNTKDRQAEAGRRIRIAIEEGKMTPEEGRKKMQELREKLGKVNNKRKGR